MKFLWILAGLWLSATMAVFGIHELQSRIDILYPTRVCQIDTRRYLKNHPGKEVHGLCHDSTNDDYVHVWAEENGQAISWGILHGKRVQFTMPANDFREAFQCQ